MSSTSGCTAMAPGDAQPLLLPAGQPAAGLVSLSLTLVPQVGRAQ